MNAHTPQQELAPISRLAGVFVTRRQLPFGLRWLPVLTLFLLLLPDCDLAAEVVELTRPPEVWPETASPPSWLARQVVERRQVANAPPDLPEPDSDVPALSSIAGDGLKPLTQVTLDVQPKPGEVPPNAAAVKFARAGRISQPIGSCRPWSPQAFCWKSPAFCHQPLYFEEVNLERYGYSYGVAQPLVSAAHFFGTIPAMPYLMTAERPCECVYTLGHYLPGSCAPYHVYFPPPSLKGGLVEAAVVTGLIFALP